MYKNKHCEVLHQKLQTQVSQQQPFLQGNVELIHPLFTVTLLSSQRKGFHQKRQYSTESCDFDIEIIIISVFTVVLQSIFPISQVWKKEEIKGKAVFLTIFQIRE